MFDASTSVQVGNGTRALFWSDRWVEGEAIPQLTPDLVQAVHNSVRRTRTVVQALQNETWISDTVCPSLDQAFPGPAGGFATGKIPLEVDFQSAILCRVGIPCFLSWPV
jgi:hypothetical protein